ncbi:MAG: DNA gyrase C-terminal beta-propeller domain-containing protein, partial [Patescibacteria group bacterium]
EKIANLVKDKKIIGIKALRDESNKDGVRIVMDLKKDAYPQKVLNRLYTLTDLQKNFNANMLALVDGIEPRILNLKEILEYYIAHRREVVVRRTQFDLNKAKERAHILEGLSKALDHIDKVIETIKKSRTRETAHDNLRKKFKFSDLQATAILEMRLQTLAGLERKKIDDELKEKMRLIKKLEAILKSEKKQKDIVKDELTELTEKFGDARKTKVFKSAVGEFKQEDLVPNEEALITMTTDGCIKRMNPSNYKVQKRGGKGVIGGNTKEDASVKSMLSIMTHDNLFFFTNTGKVFQTKAYEIPESTRTAKGNAVVNFLQLAPNEEITEIIPFNKDDQFKFLFMATKQGVVKKVKIKDFDNVRRGGLIAIKLKGDDRLKWVKPTTGTDEVSLITAGGQAIRFKEANVRPMGRSASGVRGIRLKKDDLLVGMDVMFASQRGAELFILTENGYGKKTKMTQYKAQRRGGSGIKTAKITPKTGQIVAAYIVSADDTDSDVIITSANGQIIRTPLGNISTLSRATQGVRIMKPKKNDHLSAATIL